MFSYLHRGILWSNRRFLSDDNNANSDSLVLRNQNTALSTQHHTSAGIKCSAVCFREECQSVFVPCQVMLQTLCKWGGGCFHFKNSRIVFKEQAPSTDLCKTLAKNLEKL